MWETVNKILEEIDHWKDNSSTEDTLDSLTSVETLTIKIQEMNQAILQEEEDVATEFPSILKLLIKKISITGNNPLVVVRRNDLTTTASSQKGGAHQRNNT